MPRWQALYFSISTYNHCKTERALITDNIFSSIDYYNDDVAAVVAEASSVAETKGAKLGNEHLHPCPLLVVAYVHMGFAPVGLTSLD
mmetsp:Transcript_9963/g.18888  ORF Transcript_9963/g.18888 Transcript_9963/m.18888 type:complete len:87 (+) Transcript_9963:1723-1983(+)